MNFYFVDQVASGGIPREIRRSFVTPTERFAAGAVGEVWKGILDESPSGGSPGFICAIKTSKETYGEGAEELLKEATVMAQVEPHTNICSLIGVVTSGAPLMLLLAFCEHGSALSYVKKNNPSTKLKIKFVFETAKGMAHLAKAHFIHRDLAARNVMVDGILTCKVGDFGLSRAAGGTGVGSEGQEEGQEDYYRSQNGVFPVRWTAPEAMESLKFTNATDVWSFGITAIEIFTDGAKPYDGMNNAGVINSVM